MGWEQGDVLNQNLANNKMSHLQKIDKQVHISSVFVCSNEAQKSYKSASWFRRSENSKTLIKKESFEDRSDSVYNCSLFDFGSYIDLELQTTVGLTKKYEYGPIKLDKKTQTLLENELSKTQSFPVTVLLNKNQKFPGQVSFSKIQTQLLFLVLNIQDKSIEVEIAKPRKWNQCEELFNLKGQNPDSIGLNLGHKKLQFVKNLSKLNIYCHYGNYLQLCFKSESQKNMFLLHLLALIEFKTILKSEKNSNERRYSLRFSQINNLFASTDCFTDAMTPHLNENVLEDFRNIIFTPKPDLDRQIRQRGFISLQNFIGLEDAIHRQSHKVLESIKTDETIKAIKEEEIEEENDARNKSNQPHVKSHDFIFASNKNRDNLKKNKSKDRADLLKKMKVRSSRNRINTKQAYYHHLSYEQLLERNKFLQEQGRRLIQENSRLKRQVAELESIIKSKSKSKSKSREHAVPQFIKEKIFQKNLQKNYSSHRQDERTASKRKYRCSSISKHSKDFYKLSETLGLRDSTPNRPGNFNFVNYLNVPYHG